MNSYVFAAALTAITTIVLAIAGYIYTRPLREAQTLNYDIESVTKINDALNEEIKRLTVSEKQLRLTFEAQDLKCKADIKDLQDKNDDRQQENWRLRDRLETLERQLGVNPDRRIVP